MVKPRAIEEVALFEDSAPQKWGAFSFVKTNVCRCEKVWSLGDLRGKVGKKRGEIRKSV